jgi:hypothetical protein
LAYRDAAGSIKSNATVALQYMVEFPMGLDVRPD